MKNSFHDILRVLRCGAENAIGMLGEIYRMPGKNHRREKRKKRENFIENIFLFV
jgi:hypothetical protein